MRPPEWLVRGATEAAGVSVGLIRSGVWRAVRPSHLLPIERALRRGGQSVGALGGGGGGRGSGSAGGGGGGGRVPPSGGGGGCCSPGGAPAHRGRGFCW